VIPRTLSWRFAAHHGIVVRGFIEAICKIRVHGIGCSFVMQCIHAAFSQGRSRFGRTEQADKRFDMRTLSRPFPAKKADIDAKPS
jgi:hypothetical protein